MNVLVACEYSGIVRDAFENKGWNAWSCDLLPTESEQTKKANKHYEGNIFEILDFYITDRERNMPEKWDLFIAFPPCTYLSYVYMGDRRYKPERLQKTADAIKFFIELWNAQIEHICLENPVGVIQHILPYTQIIHPYYFGKETGEDYTKRTCLWLKNLPLLSYRKEDTFFEKSYYIEAKKYFYNANNSRSKKPVIHKAFSSGIERSKFHKGIANAMAEQWTEYILNNQ